MKILFAAGGTAGHVNPAIAIAEAMQKRDKDLCAVFIGRQGGEESKGIRERGFKVRQIKVEGLHGFSVKSVKSLFLAMTAIKDAKKIILEEKPDATVATGGYISWPVIKASLALGVPTFLHESNAYPGLVTRLIGHKCTLLLGCEDAKAYLKNGGDAITVGNPLRESFRTLSRSEARRRLKLTEKDILIVSFGGSLGSKALNDACISLMRELSLKEKHIVHIHAAGRRYYDGIKAENEDLCYGKDGCVIKPYIDDMANVLSGADITVSRAGALTVAELGAVGCCAILVPSPNVRDDHQTKNAKALCKDGAAVMIEEKNLSEKVLKDTVEMLVSDRAQRAKMCKKIHAMHDPECAKKICEIIESVTAEKNKSARK